MNDILNSFCVYFLKIGSKERTFRLSIVLQIYNPSTWEAEAER
jgi:hypothetical protein